ncbi:MAG: DUF63 family protein [Candidatus Diapherotrites archaeon]
MLEAIGEFVQKYFVESITQYQGYNLVNTLVYIAILLAVSFFIIYPLLAKRGVKFNLKFMLAVFPYIVFGSTIRILEDLRIFARSANPFEPGFYSVSPGIYIAVGLLAVFCLLLSLFLAKKLNKDYLKIFGIIGWVLAIPIVIFDLAKFIEPMQFIGIIALTAALTGIAYFIGKAFRKDFFADLLGIFPIAGQALDGSATFFAVGLSNCGEQHVASNIILNIHPLLFPIVKVALALAIVYFVKAEIKNENLRGFALVFIAIMGFAPGIRDVFTVAVGTCL